MIVVPTPMISSVAISICLRPIRSPKWPNSTLPSGRARNPTAKVANATIRPVASGRLEKNASPKTSAAAVP